MNLMEWRMLSVHQMQPVDPRLSILQMRVYRKDENHFGYSMGGYLVTAKTWPTVAQAQDAAVSYARKKLKEATDALA